MHFNGVIIPHTRDSYSSGKDKFAEIVWNEYDLAKLILKREWLISPGWIVIIEVCMDIRRNFWKCYYMVPISRVDLS